MYDKSEDIITEKKEYLLPCLYHFYKNPPVIVRGKMQYLYDTEGKQYTDFYAGVSVMNCGHCNDEIIEPVINQIRKLQHTTTIYLTEPIVNLAKKLVNFMDCSLKKVFFVNSGTEANEGALLLSKLYTGRNGFIALKGGLHGRTSLTMNLTGIDMWRTDPEIKQNIYFAPRPCCSQCELGKKFPECDYACANIIGDIIREKGDISAFIAEPIQGNGGIIVPPEGYFQRVKQILEREKVLLIFDEVQTGFCRTGKKFCFMNYGVEPDILSGAKSLGNGFPIGFFAATDEIARIYTRPGASTTGGNPVCATAAINVIEYMEKNNLAKKAESLGNYLKSLLVNLKEKYPVIYEVRGLGLMIGIELRLDGTPLTDFTDIVLEGLKDNGFLVGKTGINRNVITFQPPLIITERDLDSLIESLDKELEKLCVKSEL